MLRLASNATRRAANVADVNRLAPLDGAYWVLRDGTWTIRAVWLAPNGDREWSSLGSEERTCDEDMIGCEIVGPIAEPG